VIEPGFWRDRRVLVTGPTGLRGTWETLWLHALGAEVYGFASEPSTTPSLTSIDQLVTATPRDLDELAAVEAAVGASPPEVVFQLGAQAVLNQLPRGPRRHPFHLNPLSEYVCLAKRLAKAGRSFAEGWNSCGQSRTSGPSRGWWNAFISAGRETSFRWRPPRVIRTRRAP
jgi:hypothetical protein